MRLPLYQSELTNGATGEVNLKVILDDLHRWSEFRGLNHFVTKITRSPVYQNSSDVFAPGFFLKRSHVLPKLFKVLDSWLALLALNDYRSIFVIKQQHIEALTIGKYFLADL